MMQSILAAFLLCVPIMASAMAGNLNPLPKAQWVEVLRPMMACGNQGNDDAALRQTLLAVVANPNAKLPDGCAKLKAGDKYLLDDEQSEEDTKIAVKMWAPVCTKGCVPSMTPVFSPPGAVVGIYLKPTKPPKDW
jgi:hypothetical protein